MASNAPDDPFAAEKAFQVLEGEYGMPLNEAQRAVIGLNLATVFSILNEWDIADRAQQQPLEVTNDHDLITHQPMQRSA